jgi:electron transfer flavoprotein alpha subunit
MHPYSDVMAFCEVSDGDLTETSKELLGCGTKLASDLGESLVAVLAGSEIKEFAKQAIAYGADTVFTVDDPYFANYRSDVFVSMMEKLVKKVLPQVLLFGQTSVGRDLAPRLAFRLETAVTMDCVDLEIEPDSKLLLQTKPVYGGNALAVYSTELKPQMASVRVKAMKPLDADTARSGEIISFPFEIAHDEFKTKIIEKKTEDIDGVGLEAANFVIGGGRGIGSAEAYEKLEEIAADFGGATGASRAVCDNGWAPASKQIGLTGRVIAPNIYVAVAISGASQHMAGCYGAETIVAINKDQEANIFRESDFGVVGDWNDVLPGFINKLKELKSG